MSRPRPVWEAAARARIAAKKAHPAPFILGSEAWHHALFGLFAGLLVAGLVACPQSQPAADAEHGFEHTVALSRCAQEARQAATNASVAVGSDAGPGVEQRARRAAALTSFDLCLDKMKDGGI